MPKTFSFQLHTSAVHHPEVVAALVEAIEQAGGQITDRADEDGFSKVNACVENPNHFWITVMQNLESCNADPDPLTMMLVVCEGDRGWDDYLLLFHFDRTIKVDTLS